MASFNINGIVSVLEQAGVAASNIPSAVAGLMGLSPTSKIKAGLVAILSNSGNMAVVQDEVKQISEIPNVPVAVMLLLPSISAATTQQQVLDAVRNVETALG
jgi:hypothetical protein